MVTTYEAWSYLIERLLGTCEFSLINCQLNRSNLVLPSRGTAFKMSDAGVAFCKSAISHPVSLATPSQIALTERLAHLGAIKLSMKTARHLFEKGVTAIVPCFEDATQLERCLASLGMQGYIDEIIVVDDASRNRAEIERLTSKYQGIYLRLEVNQGPAAARNYGASFARGATLVFCDCDVAVDSTLSQVLDIVAHSAISIAAPRVVAAASNHFGDSANYLLRYETTASPLDMGEVPQIIDGNQKIWYLPSACLAIDATVFSQLEGFNERLRFGEDVDLVLRATKASHLAYYCADVQVRHAIRGSFGGFLRQRFNYGSASADLAQRHGQVISHLVLDEISLAMGFQFQLGLALRFLGYLNAARRWSRNLAPTQSHDTFSTADIQKALQSIELELRGLVRALGVPLIAASLANRWIRTQSTKLILARALLAATNQITQDLSVRNSLQHVFLTLCDDLSYSCGLTFGSLRQKTLAAFVPRRHRRASRLTAYIHPNKN